LVDPVTPSLLYAAVYGQGIYKSVNGATSWQPANTGLSPFGLDSTTLALAPSAPSRLYLATVYAGLWTSGTGAGTWEPLTAGVLPTIAVSALAVDPGIPTTLYAVARKDLSPVPSTSDLFKSTTGGITWQALGIGSRNPRTLTIAPTTPPTIYLGTANQGIVTSVDGGLTWTPMNAGLPAETGVTSIVVAPG